MVRPQLLTNTSPTLLVVDDDPLARHLLTDGLSTQGYDVIEAPDGEEALRLCAHQTVDLAILDYAMPGLSGIETAQLLRGQFNVPFLFVTAIEEETIRKAAVNAGALGYLVKPIRVRDALTTVESALSRAKDLHHLGKAMTETRLINIALGLLMAKHRLTHDLAWAKLREQSRSERRRTIDVASDHVAEFEASLAGASRQ